MRESLTTLPLTKADTWLLVLPGKGIHQHSSFRFVVAVSHILSEPPPRESSPSPPHMPARSDSLSPSPREEKTVFPSLLHVNEIEGHAAAKSLTNAKTRLASVAVVFMNFLRAGSVKNRSSTDTLVPGRADVLSCRVVPPPSTRIIPPSSSSLLRDRSSRRLTAAMLARASPRNPRDMRASSSSTVLILLVA